METTRFVGPTTRINEFARDSAWAWLLLLPTKVFGGRMHLMMNKVD